MPHYLQLKYGISEAALWGGPIPQVSFTIAHSTSWLSIVLPLQGNLIHIF